MAARLLNKVVVITGAGRGLGRAIAELFLQEGARIVVLSRTRSELESLEQVAPARVVPVVADVTQSDDLVRLADTVSRRFRQIDVLCPFAGNIRFSEPNNPDEQTERQQYDLHVWSVLQTTQKLIPACAPQSSIIFPTAAPVFQELAGLEMFAAQKAMISAMAHSFSRSDKSGNIRYNCLACPPVKTSGWELPELRKLSSSSDWKWLGSEEVAQSALYLASDSSRNLNGQELVLSVR